MDEVSCYATAMEALSDLRSALPDTPLNWSVGGELDSPRPPGHVKEVSRRQAMCLEQLVARMRPGHVLLLAVDHGSAAIAHHLVAWALARQRDRQGPPPAWIRGWTVDFTAPPQQIISTATDDAATHAASRCVVVERPDLSPGSTGTIDGMKLRTALARWVNTFPNDVLVVIVGPESFAYQDPYPGWTKAHVPAACSDAAESLDGLPDFNPPASPSADAMGKAQQAAVTGDDCFAALYRLFAEDVAGRPHSDVFLPFDILSRIERATLRGWLRSLLPDSARSPCIPHALRSTRADALVAVRLYVCLHRLEQSGSRATFSERDVGRWFCFLRSIGHELLAVVASRLDRENLAGVNLMHAPPLAHACMIGADLSDSDLYRIDLSNADLRDTGFARADLSRSHLKGADLRGATLAGADLSYSSLELADLRGVNLQGADLYRCYDDDCLRDGSPN